MKNIIVVDIDGTLSHVGDRLKFLQQKPEDWDAFYDACFEDEPIQEMCDLVNLLQRKGNYHIVFLTGRRESVRGITLCWLSKKIFNSIYKPGPRTLLMRPNKDHRDDTEVKIEQFKKAGYKIEDVAFVLEDRNSMVAMWRDLGVRCLQVAEGDF